MTASTAPAIAAIVARLAAIADHDAIDGEPAATPSRRYFCVYDQTGSQIREKYHASAGRVRLPLQVSCVARTRLGVRESAMLARAALAGWAPVDGATGLVEDGSAPVITDGPTGDVRITQPLIFHCYLP